MPRFWRSVLPIAILTSFLLISACGSPSSGTSQKPTPTRPPAACHAPGTPQGPAGTLTEFPVPSSGFVAAMTAGPDGNLWFINVTDFLSEQIGQITSTGTTTEFPLPRNAAAALMITDTAALTTGPDGNLWVGEAGFVGRFTLDGKITEFPFPSGDNGVVAITTGPDNNLWFTEHDYNYEHGTIGRMTPTGQVMEFPLPGEKSNPTGITAGPDGNLWVAESGSNAIGRITPSGTITEFPLPTAHSGPRAITCGPDGNLWFTEYLRNRIGRITPAGKITEFLVPPHGEESYLSSITVRSDGNLWFTESSIVFSTQVGAGEVVRITPAGVVTEFPVPSDKTYSPQVITAGPDGNLWVASLAGDKIGRITCGP